MIGMRMLNAFTPVVFTLLLGWLAGRRRLIEGRTFVAINLMLMNFALPASLFVAMARTKAEDLRHDFLVALVLAAAMLGLYGLVWLLMRRAFRATRGVSAVQALTVAFPNCAAIGLPLLSSVFGPPSAAIAALGIAVGAVVISPLTIALLERETLHEGGRAAGLGAGVFRAFLRPVVFAPLLGIAFAATGIGVGDLPARSLLLLGQGAAGIALFLTGLILSAQRFSLTRSMLCGVLLKNILQPLFVYCLAKAVHLPHPMLEQVTLLAGVPAGFFGTVFGARFGVDSPEASSTLVASTVAGLATLAAIMVWLRI